MRERALKVEISSPNPSLLLTLSWYLSRYKILKFLFYSSIYRPFELSFLMYFYKTRRFTDLLALDLQIQIMECYNHKNECGDKQNCPMNDPDSFSGLLDNNHSGMIGSLLSPGRATAKLTSSEP